MTMKLKRTLGCYVLKLKTMLSELVLNFWVKLILGFIVYIFCSMVYVYLSQKIEIIRYYKYGTTEDLRSSEYVNTKKVLFWNKYLGSEDYNFGIGKRPFVKNKCPFDDCLIIYHKYLFPVEDYDAIVFNGDDFNPWTNLYFPPKRRTNQRYVYYSTSVKRKPPYLLDVFYNITITDRIDSDVTIRTFDVFKSTDNKTNKDGINYIKDWDVFYKTKRRIGFWLYYDCKEVNIEIEQLIKELKEVIEVDVFCDCKRGKNCFDKQLQASVFNEYFFIFFIEDPNDFVYNEDIMVALRHRVVPVLFRDVNYDNFLPPNSYFKAGNLSKAALVESVQISASSLQEFSKYFTWFSSYEIANSLSPFCKLCEILHSDRTVKVYSIDWWNNMYDNVA